MSYQSTDYHAAYEHARQEADRYARPMAIEKAREYGKTVFRVKHIPTDPAKRFGWETRCEVVNPGSPRCETCVQEESTSVETSPLTF